MRGGTSRIDISPPKGVPMGGYLARSKPAGDIRHPLFARAIVLDDGQERVAILSADLLALDVSTAKALRERISARTGIPPSHTMIACTHTHSGPLVTKRRIGELDHPYVETLHDRLVEVTCAAAESLRPVRLGASRAKTYLGVNRRVRTPDNRMEIGRNPAGYACPYAHILVVGKDSGSPIGILFTYGAHPVVLGPENLLISGDYAGVAEREVEENFGDQAVALFALGFAGDVNVNFEKRDIEEAETIGVALGRAVLEEIKAVELTPDLGLQVRSVSVPLPLEAPPSLTEAERLLYEAREQLGRVLGRGEKETTINERRAMVDWAAQLVETVTRGDAPTSTDLEVQVVALGRIALVALSAEVFADYARELQPLSPFDHTFFISNANGSVGYIPVAAAFDEGGYEVDRAPHLLGTLAFRPEVDATVRQTILGLLHEMAGVAAVPSGG